MRYSTYQSIYEPSTTNKSDNMFSNWFKQVVVHIFKSTIHNRFVCSRFAKILMLTMLLIVTCTGMVSAFAASDSARNVPLETVIVHSGDTLWGIAEKYKPTGSDTRVYIEGIKKKNDLSGSQIEVGDVLVMPRFK